MDDIDVQVTIDKCSGLELFKKMGRWAGCTSQVAIKVDAGTVITMLDKSYRNPRVYVNGAEKSSSETIMLGSTEVKVEPAKLKNGESSGLGFALVVHTSNFEFQVSPRSDVPSRWIPVENHHGQSVLYFDLVVKAKGPVIGLAPGVCAGANDRCTGCVYGGVCDCKNHRISNTHGPAPVSLPSGVSCPEFAGLENLRDRATPEWCNTDTARRNSATECHKYFVYSTGTGMYQKCKHDDAAGACKMAGDTCTASSAIRGGPTTVAPTKQFDLINTLQCKLPGGAYGWGLLKQNFGEFATFDECKAAILKESSCNKHMFVWGCGRRGCNGRLAQVCQCFADKTATMQQCEWRETPGTIQTYGDAVSRGRQEQEELQVAPAEGKLQRLEEVAAAGKDNEEVVKTEKYHQAKAACEANLRQLVSSVSITPQSAAADKIKEHAKDCAIDAAFGYGPAEDTYQKTFCWDIEDSISVNAPDQALCSIAQHCVDKKLIEGTGSGYRAC